MRHFEVLKKLHKDLQLLGNSNVYSCDVALLFLVALNQVLLVCNAKKLVQ